MNKVHVAISEDPLPSNRDTKAICKDTVPNAQWTVQAENPGSTVRELFNRLNTCTKCWNLSWEGGRYLYGMVQGVPEEPTLYGYL